MNHLIRESDETDLPSIQTLYSKAFPDEDLLPLVTRLIGGEARVLSLVAAIGSIPEGHIVFTYCGPGDQALLGPLAIAPRFQRQGLGSSLVKEGLRRLAGAGIENVFVLGDPDYYSRFGFACEAMIRPPYPLPPAWSDAWQSLELNGPARMEGNELVLPAVWLEPSLWTE